VRTIKRKSEGGAGLERRKKFKSFAWWYVGELSIKRTVRERPNRKISKGRIFKAERFARIFCRKLRGYQKSMDKSYEADLIKAEG